MNQWLSAQRALRTDWTDIDPRNRPAPYSEAPATIPCGLLAKLQRKGRGRTRCARTVFFSELGRELHHAEEHHVGLALVEAPAPGARRGEEDGTRARRGTNTDPKRAASTYELRPTGLLGRKRKVRVS